MIGCLDVFQVQLEFLMFDDMMFDDMLYPAIMQGPDSSTSMQLSSQARCSATSVVCWFCF